MAVNFPLIVQQLIPYKQGCPQRAAGVSGCGLNPDIVEGTFAEDSAVTDAVESHTACQCEVLHPGLIVYVSCGAQHNLFGNRLD